MNLLVDAFFAVSLCRHKLASDMVIVVKAIVTRILQFWASLRVTKDFLN